MKALFLVLLVTVSTNSQAFKSALVDKESVKCLAEAVYFEARGEPIRRYIVDVVFNRVKSKYFPNDICAVVYQPYQFSFTITEKTNVMSNKKSKERAYRTASLMYDDWLSGDYVDATNGALYYYNPDKVLQTPDWVSPEFYLFTSANHRFYSWHKNS